jgi:hypothetical protein
MDKHAKTMVQQQEKQVLVGAPVLIISVEPIVKSEGIFNAL